MDNKFGGRTNTRRAFVCRYALTVNAGAARKIGLTLPPGLLAQAGRVIE